MANAPIGNNFWEGPLGVVNVEFNTVALGKTTAATSIEFIDDVFDVIYQQNGTQPYDKIPTGQAYQVTCTFGEIDTELMTTLFRGVTRSSGSGNNSVKLGRDIYRSGRDSFAQTLVLKKVDSDGVSSTDPLYQLNFYLAMPTITGAIEYGSDTQKNVEVQFYCFYDETHGAFGYSGYASSVGL